jgi:hypothetical protein
LFIKVKDKLQTQKIKQKRERTKHMKTITNGIYIAFALVAFACFALSPIARAVSPPPDGGYPGFNTAEGEDALFSLTSGGNNTAIGFTALHDNTTGGENTATGYLALEHNTTGSLNTATGSRSRENNTIGSENTATGFQALFTNTAGSFNTAMGVNALFHNDTNGSDSGNENTAIGHSALFLNEGGDRNTGVGVSVLYNNNGGGSRNTAVGASALFYSFAGNDNVAIGDSALMRTSFGNGNSACGRNALFSNTTGERNTGMGGWTLYFNVTGSLNTAIGSGALAANVGNRNVALGADAGSGLTTGNDNIDIGNVGVAGESGKIRIGTAGVQTAALISGIYNVNEGGTIKPVYINSNGQLGTQPPASARRFKEEIKTMEKSSEGILKLKPVTFRYKNDAERTPQFGLIAEEVAKVNPDLVVRDEHGEIYTVRYDAVNAMLLNEFLKEHRKNEEQQATIAQLKSGMDALTATVNEQAAQIQKVSAQLELSKPAPQTVLNNR